MVAGAVAAASLVGVVALGGIGATDASWTTAETGSAVVTAGTVNPPRATGCNQPFLQSPIFTWTAPATGGLLSTGYRVTFTDKATGTVVTSVDQTATSIQPSPGGLLTIGSYTVTIVSIGPGTWTSVAAPTATFNVLLGLVTSCSVP